MIVGWHRKLYEAAISHGLPKDTAAAGATHGAGHRGPRAGRSKAPAPTNSLGSASGPTIIVHGTDAQKKRYLKKI